MQGHSAASWASTVSTRRYAARRSELDELVVAVIPSYRMAVTGRLDDFAASVRGARDRYDSRHLGAQFIRPWRIRWAQQSLFWVFILGIVGSFALMYPVGGRAIGAVDFSAIDWALFVMLSAILFVLGVIAQLLRRLPLRAGIPPRKDLAWLPAALGTPTLVMMIVNLDSKPRVEPLYVTITAVALTASILYALTRIVQRRRNPQLTQLVDTSEKARLRASADSIKAEADRAADLIERDFHALAPHHRALITSELEDAVAVLQERGLIRTLSAAEKKQLAQRQIIGRRPMVPGFLLLERRVQAVWDPYFSEPGTQLGVTWHVAELLPKPAGPRS